MSHRRSTAESLSNSPDGIGTAQQKTLIGFAPVAHKSATVLILGSMPGRHSLTAGQYYAHPRNAFWAIMQHLIGLDPEASYEARMAKLRAAGIALWDVLQSCERPGSLDAHILTSSIAVNNFREFFRRHSEIRRVYFNGAAAEQFFRKRVLQELSLPKLDFCRLPSTSPACTLSFEIKLRAWKAVRPYPE